MYVIFRYFRDRQQFGMLMLTEPFLKEGFTTIELHLVYRLSPLINWVV